LIDIIINAAVRSADLTKKLLAFGRKGKIHSTLIDLHDIINDSSAIIARTFDKKINLVVNTEALSSYIVGDNSAIQNSIMNLGINAAHSMEDGGNLTLTTKNIRFDKNYCETSAFELIPGEYIELEVRDSGCGIPLEHIKDIFEPFFTTKEEGVGTGLGLSAVYGTVKDHHGAITVYSESGTGTVFHLYFPCSGNEVEQKETNNTIIAGSGIILLVDDEELIRMTGKLLLESMGYTVQLANNGLEAVELFEKNYSDITLVIIDIIMPVMNGREAFLKMKEIDPECRVIMASGFTNNENIEGLHQQGLKGFLNKPFSRYELSQVLTSALEQK